jgi:preprotein translocase subunit SecA
MLQAIDNHWINHIDDMQYLREKVGLYGYAQLDPLMIYKKEAYEKFELLNANIHQEIIVNLLKANVPQNRDIQINMMPSEQPQIIKINTD